MKNSKLKTCFFIISFCLLFSVLHAQTKIIAHKSHSGSNENFKIAYETGFFDIENSNFGMAPEPTVRSSSLDSLIFLSDSVAVIVTSERCERRQRTSKWSAGKDTLYNHFLFTKKNSPAYIKNYLKQYYNFQNPVDSVKFINADSNEQQYQLSPVGSIADDGNNGPSGNSPLFFISLLALFSIFAGGIYYMLTKMQKIY